ncbi:MAG: polysulfide reductase NrfD [Magnetococcus sp. MYC-9]
MKRRLWWGIWLTALLLGLQGYTEQWRSGLAVTGLSDSVLWGLYISQFVFLVGVAASAVILVIPVWLFDHPTARALLRLAESLALTAVVMSLLFVTVDLGQPARLWHALPVVGQLQFPQAIIVWDLLVLIAYLLLTLLLWAGWRHPAGILLAAVLGVAIHTVTAFLLAGHPARPFWHTGVMAPRFIMSAFASGAALLLLLQRFWPAGTAAWGEIYLRRLFLACLGIDFFLWISEGFVWFYRVTADGESARLLYGGGLGFWSLWVWTGIGLKGVALWTAWRHGRGYGWGVLGVWMEKGLGLIVPGFIPTPLGEVVHYWPSRVELQVTLGIWALGLWLLSRLLRPTGPEHGQTQERIPP